MEGAERRERGVEEDVADGRGVGGGEDCLCEVCGSRGDDGDGAAG